jgi:hypothetical protein
VASCCLRACTSVAAAVCAADAWAAESSASCTSPADDGKSQPHVKGLCHVTRGQVECLLQIPWMDHNGMRRCQSVSTLCNSTCDLSARCCPVMGHP